MKNNMGLVFQLIVVAVTFGLCAWLTELIWNSDMPTWLKWMLLR